MIYGEGFCSQPPGPEPWTGFVTLVVRHVFDILLVCQRKGSVLIFHNEPVIKTQLVSSRM